MNSFESSIKKTNPLFRDEPITQEQLKSHFEKMKLKKVENDDFILENTNIDKNDDSDECVHSDDLKFEVNKFRNITISNVKNLTIIYKS